MVSLEPGAVDLELTPEPSQDLHWSMLVLPAGCLLHRVHLDRYAGDAFNPGSKGNARFSPIQNAQGQPIPTLYGGSSIDCALMETVFHDVPFAPGFKSQDKAKLNNQQHSSLRLTAELQLVDLRSKALRKLGIRRQQLIDTEKSQYPLTRLWAQALHAQVPSVQGLCWTSRQDDSALALMLFGDRIASGVLSLASPSRSLLGDAELYEQVLDLAERIGVNLLAANSAL